jgi:hypothetical protein
MRVYELAMVVNLSGEVGVIFFGRFEHNLRSVSRKSLREFILFIYFRTIGELMCSKINLPE